jgi:outer membrane protein assembly factor BamD (BamD/ComL family)
MRFLSLLCVVLLATSAPAFAGGSDENALPEAGASASAPAPADEYFGRLKMSILGIRNQLQRLTQEVEEDPGNAPNTLGTAGLTEDSIKEWEAHYPRDPWLAKTVYLVVHLYAKMPPKTGHAQALKALSWLIAKYPGSEFTTSALQEVGTTTQATNP